MLSNTQSPSVNPPDGQHTTRWHTPHVYQPCVRPTRTPDGRTAGRRRSHVGGLTGAPPLFGQKVARACPENYAHHFSFWFPFFCAACFSVWFLCLNRLCFSFRLLLLSVRGVVCAGWGVTVPPGFLASGFLLLLWGCRGSSGVAGFAFVVRGCGAG